MVPTYAAYHHSVAKLRPPKPTLPEGVEAALFILPSATSPSKMPMGRQS
jgi:hypothetical protein